MTHKETGLDSAGITRQDIEHLARTGQLTIDRPIYAKSELAEVQVLMDGIRAPLSEVPDD